MSIRSHCLAIVVAMFACMLTACGGGGGGGDKEPSAPAPILAQPGDVLVTAGLPATFSVSIGAPATVQWQRLTNGVWADIPGATSSSYTLASAQAVDDSASFKAVLTPTDGGPALSSSPVTLRVVAQPLAPSVIVNPGDQSVTAGQGATFAVTATGTSLTYRWQRRGSADASFADIPGASGSTLVLALASDGDDGAFYRVVISNTLNSVTSTPARLTVTRALSAPVFTTAPSNVTVVAGQPASLSITLTGEPAPTLGWQRSTDGITWADIPGQTSSTLVLPAVALSLHGTQYRAVAINTSGTVFSLPGVLTVQAAPVAPFIVTQPSDAAVGAGSTARFVVEAGGTPAPALQWQVSLDGATFTNITGATGVELTLPSITMADNGKKLRVLAHSSAGSITSDSVTLTVRAGPQINRQPQAQAWRTGLPLPIFSVDAVGSGLSYQWQTSDSQGAGFQNIAGATASTLTTFTPPNRDSWIRVVVRNAAGDATTSESTRLAKLSWTYLSPLPTGDTMRAFTWLSDTTVVGAGQGGTVIRSTDAGQSWTTVRESSGQPINSMAFGSSSIGIAVGAVDGRGLILRTVDGGLHWQQVPGVSSPELVSVGFYDANTVVAVAREGTMLRSLDGGRNWAPVGTGITSDWIAVAFRAGLGIAVNNDGHIFRSINGGAQWEKTFTPTGVRYRQVLTFVSDTTVVIANQFGVTRSTDGGQTWQDIDSRATYWGSYAMAFANATQGVVLPFDTGTPAFNTNDGGITWTQSSAWPDDFNGTAIAFRGDVGVAAGEQGRLYRTADRGQTWIAQTAQIESLAGVAFGSPAVGVAISEKTLYRTSDTGAHWTAVGTNLTPLGLGETWKQVVFLDASTVIALDSTGRIVRSTDSGVNWSFASSTPIAFPFMIGEMAFSSPTVGWLVVNRTLRRTTDGGMTWQDMPNAGTCINSVTFPSSTRVISLGCDGTFQRSLDGGQTWQEISFAYDSLYLLRDVAFASEQVGVAVGRYGRIVRTADGGATWAIISPPTALRFTHMYHVWFVSPTVGYLISEGAGIYRTGDGGLTWALDNWRGTSHVYFGVKTGVGTSVGLGVSGLVMLRSELE